MGQAEGSGVSGGTDGKNPDSLASRSMECLSSALKDVAALQSDLTRTQDRIHRREYRWKMMRIAVVLLGFLVAGLSYYSGAQKLLAPSGTHGPYAALVRVEGLIEADQRASAEKINASLEAAFDDPQARAVIVLINSPGGSPVQASLIHDRLLALRAKYPGRTVRVIGQDMLTSGAYYIAVAGDKLCVNRSTLTGSIGVVLRGWGLQRAIERWGIERRVFTAGTNKARLDAFKPLTRDDELKANALVESIHTQFIDAVRVARGDRLKGDPKSLWSGDFWTGEQAVALGLVDGICDLNSVMEHDLHVSQVHDYTQPVGLLGSVTQSLGIASVRYLLTDVEGLQPELLPP